jgi:ABC-type polysaccharide/polyol phosphate export permease
VLANPMAGLIQGYRDCLLYQRWPDVTYLGIVLAGSLLTILAACKIISHYDRVYPKIC